MEIDLHPNWWLNKEIKQFLGQTWTIILGRESKNNECVRVEKYFINLFRKLDSLNRK